MIINRIKLSPFAGITDLEVKFEKNLTVILGNNEAGKSTIYKAIQKTLFTKSEPGARIFEKEIKGIIPISGDTARTELEFEHNGKIYIILKQWGTKPSSELKLPDGSIIKEEEKISRAIGDILPAPEATTKSILMTYQTGLSKTVEEIKNTDSSTIAEINNTIRNAVFNTGGISVDKFHEKLKKQERSHNGRWDFKTNGPEQRRGLDNRWINGTGNVINAYYKCEEIRKELKAAEEFEKQYDEINSKIDELRKDEIEKKEYIENNRRIVSDVILRKTLNNEIDSLKTVIDILKRVNEEWPVLESRLKEKPKEITELAEKETNLKIEKENIEKIQNNREFLQKYKRIMEFRQKLETMRATLKNTKEIKKEDINELTNIISRIENLLASINAGKIKINFYAKKPTKLSYTKGIEEIKSEELSTNQNIIIDAGGRIIFDTEDWKMEVKTGETEFEKLQELYKEEKEKLKNLLNNHKVETIDEAKTTNNIYEIALANYNEADNNYKNELNGDNFAEIDTKAKSLNADSSLPNEARNIQTVLTELINIQSKINRAQEETNNATQKINTFIEEYRDKDSLLLQLAEKVRELTQKQQTFNNLLSLPNGETDEEAFIRKFQNTEYSLENLKENIKSSELKKATLDGAMPEKSAEEIQKELETAQKQLTNYITKGKALFELLKITEELINNADTGTFLGIETEIAGSLSRLTGNKYEKVKMEKALPTAIIRQDGKEIKNNLLSAGTQDILGIAIRISISKYFLKASKGFAVIDDPLVDLDPERQKKAAELINDFAKEYQTIVFTCHPENAKMFDGHKIII